MNSDSNKKLNLNKSSKPSKSESDDTLRAGNDPDAVTGGDLETVETLLAEKAELEEQIEAEKSKASQARAAIQDAKNRKAVLDCLREKGCVKPEETFLMLEKDLRFPDKEDGEITALFDGDEMDLESFVEAFKHSRVPQLFRDNMRVGPAGKPAAAETANPYEQMKAELAQVR